MSRTYRPIWFTCLYFGTILAMALIAYSVRDHLAQGERFLVITFLTTFAILATPQFWLKVIVDDEGIKERVFIWLKVTPDDEGIKARAFLTRSVRWADIVSWERHGYVGSEGPDLITIKTLGASLTLNCNCIYGKRVDKIELELRKRVTQQPVCRAVADNERFS